QVFVLLPPLLHTPDQTTSRVLLALSVMLVPTGKLAEPVLPTGTLSPDGVDETVSPPRPLAVSVSFALAATPPPQTFATPPPPPAGGAVPVPHTGVPPQPSAMEPQFLPWAAQVVGMHPPPHTFATPPPAHVCGAVHVPHTSVPPQPSAMEPQFFPWAAQVVGVQVTGLVMKSVLVTHLPPKQAERLAAASLAG